MTHICVGNSGLGSEGLFSATDCVDNILGRFTLMLPVKLQELTH